MLLVCGDGRESTHGGGGGGGEASGGDKADSGGSGGGGGGSDRRDSPLDVDMLDNLGLTQQSEHNPIPCDETKEERLSDGDIPLEHVLRQKGSCTVCHPTTA